MQCFLQLRTLKICVNAHYYFEISDITYPKSKIKNIIIQIQVIVLKKLIALAVYRVLFSICSNNWSCFSSFVIKISI